MSKKIISYILLCSSLIITFLLYQQGLYGDYVFDDAVNILENKQLAINSLDWVSLQAAWASGDAGPLGRPISMLSFAINHYFSDFDTFYFKLTNLIIHIFNGLLVFVISLNLFQWLNHEYQYIKFKYEPYLACLVCLIWLIHPLNLTSVLYVVQRMTSLSALFGLLAVLIYCVWRIRSISGIGTLLAILAIVINLIASMLSKESGVLFIFLIFWIEIIIFKSRNNEYQPIFINKIKLYYLLWIGVGIGFCIFLYLLPPYLNATNFARREFNLEERLLTESRVIFYYIKMFFYPLLSDLSLYHDDFLISKSITNPINTFYSLFGLIAISVTCIFLVKKHPMFLFAWGWYLISQLLESTFISLELVHEHRNYFGTIGFIITAVYYLAQIRNKKIKPFVYFLMGIYIINLAWITWQRAEIWSNLVDHAVYEVAMHPNSDRANYQLARIYMNLMQLYPQQHSYYAELAKESLIHSKDSYIPGNGAWFAELHLASYLKEPVKQKNIDELIWRLKNTPFQNSNIGFLSAFTNCQISEFCKVPHDQAVLIIAAGLDNKGIDNNLKSEIYKLLAQYFISIVLDFEKGEEFLQQAITLNDSVNGRLIFAQIYRLQGKLSQANNQLKHAKRLDAKKIWIKEILIEQRNIEISQRQIIHEN